MGQRRTLRTHCKRGHSLDDGNLYVHPGHPEWRICRLCRRERTIARCAAKRKGKATHCKRGHEYSPENTIHFIGRKGRPFRACKTCRRKNFACLPLDTVRSCIQGLHEGTLLTQIERTLEIKKGRMRAFARANPRIGNRLLELARKNRRDYLQKWNRRRRITIAPALRSPDPRAFHVVIDATRILHPDIRDDVQGKMFEALAEGWLLLKDIRVRVSEFVRAHNREFSQFVPVIGGRMGSLDAKVYDDGEMTVGDTVTRGLWD